MKPIFFALIAILWLQVALPNPVNASALDAKAAEKRALQQQIFEAARSTVALPTLNAQLDAPELQTWLNVDSRMRLVEFSEPARGAAYISGAEHCELAPSVTMAQLNNGALVSAAADAQPRWIKLVQPGHQQWTLEAFAIDDDPALSAFADCNSTLLASSDNSVLLQPRLTLDKTIGATVWIKLERALGKSTQLIALQTGRISGSVNNLAFATSLNTVAAFNSAGAHVASSSIVNSRYQLDLPPGGYYIKAITVGRIAQIYDNVECAPQGVLSCNLSTATLLPLVEAQQLDGINFVLDGGAIVAGRLFDEETGLGISGAVQASVAGVLSAGANTDAAGRFTMRGFAAGTYTFKAGGEYELAQPERFLAQQYRNQNCATPSSQSCSLAIADPISLTRGETRTGIDFPLRRVSTISGAISPQFSTLVEVLNQTGAVVAGANSFGNYVISDIPVGSYKIRFSGNGQRMLYPNLLCSQVDCGDRLAEATALNIVSNRTTLTAIDGTFGETRFLRGRVLDRSSGAGISDVDVYLKRADGSFTSTRSLNGAFLFVDPPIGPVTLFANSNTHINAYFPNIDCQAPLQLNCFNNSSTAPTNFIVPLSADSSAEFLLQRGASVSGRFLQISGKQHVNTGLGLSLRTAAGAEIPISFSGLTPNNVSFLVGDLHAGSYQVGVAESSNFFLPPARQISLQAGQVMSGIDFTVQPKIGFEGRVIDSNGAAIAGVAIDFWQNTQFISTAQTDSNGWYWFPNSQTAFAPLRISTDAPQAYTNQVHQGISCAVGSVYSGRCNLRQGQEIAVPATSPSDHLINFQLSPAGNTEQIFYSDFEIGIARGATQR